MFQSLFKRFFGSRNERMVKRLYKIVNKINSLEESIQPLHDEQLAAKTEEFRHRYQQGESLDDLLPEAFAVVREAGKRVLGMRHFDVQLIGGMVLHSGKISEMRTGEGKTLVATLAAYLNALSGQGVHVVTVNDYLAHRDAAWMGKIYRFLGMSVGVVVAGMTHTAKQESYRSDITYGTNNEFGFDYLRDNMVYSMDDKVQRALNYAIIDEVDSILIDEARTPLIISGPAEENQEIYEKINSMVPNLIRQESENGPGDYSVDEKARQIYLTEEGHQHVEDLIRAEGLLPEGTNLYDASNVILMHHVNCALRANVLFNRDVDYIVKNGEVIIVDEFTGRTMIGRRWSDGLHQAIEAKEGVAIQAENQTLASITFQNYFRLYKKISGMTGTADTEAYEFHQIYGLEVLVIPTHRPMIRQDMGDLVFLATQDKFKAILQDIRDCQSRSQPVLVGTTSIETSEILSHLLTQEKIAHQVLNAKQHAREAEIVAQAGRPYAVTIATNMAGRGTDIVLGGSFDAELAALGPQADNEEVVKKLREDWQQRHDQVLKSGGLHIIGTERHESRRIDNQLRGRSGRQGDPGSSRFYVSLQDNLMRIFGADRMDRISGLMQRAGMEAGESVEHPWLTKAIENAQRKVEAYNFDIRKQLLEYDDVANVQRKAIYQKRDDLLKAAEIVANILNYRREVIRLMVDQYIPPESMEEQWNIPGLMEAFERTCGMKLPIDQWLADNPNLDEEAIRLRIQQGEELLYQEFEKSISPDYTRKIELGIMLQMLDHLWKEHLTAMDHLRQGIHLRGYAQKNPKQEYKREAFEMFNTLLERVRHNVCVELWRARQMRSDMIEEEIHTLEAKQHQDFSVNFQFEHAEPDLLPAIEGDNLDPENRSESTATEDQSNKTPYTRVAPKVGRNSPCPCGSGKKYKHCCGVND